MTAPITLSNRRVARRMFRVGGGRRVFESAETAEVLHPSPEEREALLAAYAARATVEIAGARWLVDGHTNGTEATGWFFLSRV